MPSIWQFNNGNRMSVEETDPMTRHPGKIARADNRSIGRLRVPQEGGPLTCSARESAIDVLRTRAALQIGYR